MVPTIRADVDVWEVSVQNSSFIRIVVHCVDVGVDAAHRRLAEHRVSVWVRAMNGSVDAFTDPYMGHAVLSCEVCSSFDDRATF